MTPSRSPEPPAEPPGQHAEADRKTAAPGTATQVSRTRRENRALMRVSSFQQGKLMELLQRTK